ncbi:MAG: hypothetical protein AB7E70_19675 [Hyphomicrobiaceae bacterium]
MTLYRLHSVPIAVTKDQAQQIGADIFVRVESAWIVEVSGQGAKQRLMKSPLVPSFIVETRASYQVYFAAKERPAPDTTAYRIAPYFGGAVVQEYARKPGYLDGETRVTTRWRHSVAYTARQIASVFPRAKQPAPIAPISMSPNTNLLADPMDEELVAAGILQQQLPLLAFLETDDFASRVRWLFVAARNLEARSAPITPEAILSELVRYDQLADANSSLRWSLQELQRMASVPVPVDMLLDAASRLVQRRDARALVMQLDAEAERQQQEIDQQALEDAA